MTSLSIWEFHLIGLSFSFCASIMAAATAFFWINTSQVTIAYRATVTITGIVTFIAAYNYFRLFQSWDAAFTLANGSVKETSAAFQGIFRYADWFATVPLLVIELILVMRLPAKETFSRGSRLAIAALLMIGLGYPGTVSSVTWHEWLFGALSMGPFLWIVWELYIGLGDAISKQPPEARGLVSIARNTTVLVWFFYPVVYFFHIGYTGGIAVTIYNLGYTVADILAKVGFGIIIYMIAVRKSEAERRSSGA